MPANTAKSGFDPAGLTAAAAADVTALSYGGPTKSTVWTDLFILLTPFQELMRIIPILQIEHRGSEAGSHQVEAKASGQEP